jgi:hypothetical protein
MRWAMPQRGESRKGLGAVLLRTEPATYVNPTYTEREVWELAKGCWKASWGNSVMTDKGVSLHHPALRLGGEKHLS